MNTEAFADFSADSTIELKTFVAISFHDKISQQSQRLDEINADSIPRPYCGVRSCEFDEASRKWVVTLGSCVDFLAYRDGRYVDTFALNTSKAGRTFFYGEASRTLLAKQRSQMPAEPNMLTFAPTLEFQVGGIFRKNLSLEVIEAHNVRFANVQRLKVDLLHDVSEAIFNAGGRRLGVNHISSDKLPVLKGPQKYLYIASNAHLLDVVLGPGKLLKDVELLVHPLRVPQFSESSYSKDSLVDVCFVRDEHQQPTIVMDAHPLLSFRY